MRKKEMDKKRKKRRRMKKRKREGRRGWNNRYSFGCRMNQSRLNKECLSVFITSAPHTHTHLNALQENPFSRN